jgi:hypothetical protein
VSTPASPPRNVPSRIEGVALVAVGVLWLVVAGLIAVVIRMQVPTPAELLRDVADRQAVWIASNAVLIVQAATLATGSTRLAQLSGPGEPAARGVLGIAAGAFVGSGVMHGVFGAHLASKVTAAPLGETLVLDAELTHALADTFWFVGVGALVAATALVTLVRGRANRWLGWAGAGAVAFNLLQFGWFFDHLFGLFAGPGTALQAVWFVLVGVDVLRD